MQLTGAKQLLVGSAAGARTHSGICGRNCPETARI